MTLKIYGGKYEKRSRERIERNLEEEYEIQNPDEETVESVQGNAFERINNHLEDLEDRLNRDHYDEGRSPLSWRENRNLHLMFDNPS